MKTESIVDNDTLIRQLEDQFWDERENHKAHAKLLFGEMVTLKKENAALKEQAETWKDIAIHFYNCTGDVKDLPKSFRMAIKRLEEYESKS